MHAYECGCSLLLGGIWFLGANRSSGKVRVPPAGRRRGPMNNGCIALSLGGETTLLAGSAGGEIFAQVVKDGGAVPYVKKHPGLVEYEDVTVDVGLAMSDALFDWIAAEWAGKAQPKDCVLLTAGYDFAIKAQRHLKGARIAATTIPALDATSKAAAPLSVRLIPGSIALSPGVGKLQLKSLKQRLWRASNFRLDIDGLDCSRVSWIEFS